jgi:phosphatidylserine/phosphatidylglycerophosphate/cardiolipin synthase-like enzyme
VVSVFLGNYERGSAIAKGLLNNGVNPEVPMGFEVRCGTGLGEFIMGRVRGGSEVIVVSPWLSPEVARELVELSRRARVMVITTNDAENRSHMRALDELYSIETIQDEEKRRKARTLKITGLVMLFLLGPVLLALGINLLAAGITTGTGSAVSAAGSILFIMGFLTGIVGVVLLVIGSGLANSAVRKVYVPRVSELVVLDRSAVKLHAKLVVLPSEGLVGIGSANLTFSGLQSNAECWVWLSSPEAVEDAMNFVDRLLKQSRQDLEGAHRLISSYTES